MSEGLKMFDPLEMLMFSLPKDLGSSGGVEYLLFWNLGGRASEEYERVNYLFLWYVLSEDRVGFGCQKCLCAGYKLVDSRF